MQNINFKSRVDQIDDSNMLLIYFTKAFLKARRICHLLVELICSSCIFKKVNDHFFTKLTYFPTMMDQKSINARMVLKPAIKGCDTKMCYICKNRTSGLN